MRRRRSREPPTFQYPLADRRACGVDAAHTQVRKEAFQYPLADRRACGVGFMPVTPWRVAFQYPLADRRACGRSGHPRRIVLSRFSILLRIVELAAWPIHLSPSGLPSFSILLRIVELAVYSLRLCSTRLKVSVSSCGS